MKNMLDPIDVYDKTKKYLKTILPKKYKILNTINMHFLCTNTSLLGDKIYYDIVQHISLIIYIPTIRFYNDIINDYIIQIHNKVPVVELNLGFPYNIKTINDDTVYKIDVKDEKYLNKLYDYIITNITQ